MSRKIFLFWLTVVPDALFFYASLFFAMHLWYPQGLSHEYAILHVKIFSVIFLLWLLVLYIHGLFEAASIRRYVGLVFNLVSATAINVLLAVLYLYFQPRFSLTPRRFLLLVAALSFGLTLCWHLLVKLLLKNRFTTGVYLFSLDDRQEDLGGVIEANSFLGFRVAGRLTDQSLLSAPLERGAAIVLPDSLHGRPEVAQRLYELRTQGIVFYNARDFYEQLSRRVYLSQLSELWFLENIDYQEKRLYNLVKRVVDILSGALTFILFVFSYPVIGLCIKMDSSGPILFSQKRVGKNGKIFNIYKYRSMNTVTDTTWTKKNDPRITRVGAVLRKTRLDELPQSINLIKGDLTLVGPRPEQPNIVQQLKAEVPFYDERHLVKPGLTGWAQLNIYAGSLEETKLKLQYDLYYIKHRSFLFDLEIILKTIYYIFTWQGR